MTATEANPYPRIKAYERGEFDRLGRYLEALDAGGWVEQSYCTDAPLVVERTVRGDHALRGGPPLRPGHAAEAQGDPRHPPGPGESASRVQVSGGRQDRQPADDGESARRDSRSANQRASCRGVIGGRDAIDARYSVVVNAADSFASVFDARTYTEVARLAVDPGGTNFGFTRDGSTGFMSVSAANAVAVIDMAGLSVVGQIKAGMHPQGLIIL